MLTLNINNLYNIFSQFTFNPISSNASAVNLCIIPSTDIIIGITLEYFNHIFYFVINVGSVYCLSLFSYACFRFYFLTIDMSNVIISSLFLSINVMSGWFFVLPSGVLNVFLFHINFTLFFSIIPGLSI